MNATDPTCPDCGTGPCARHEVTTFVIGPPIAPWPWPATSPDRGWICPKCGRVWAPTTGQCSACNVRVDNAQIGSLTTGTGA